MDLIIIGGGASGLAAACIAAQRGASALLLEKNDKPGKKLLATGNGRCNVMNDGAPVFFGDAAFAQQVLAACPPARVRAFLELLGLVLRREDGGRLYPAGNRADMVVSALTAPLAGGSVALRLACPAASVFREGALWCVHTAGGETLRAPSVLLAGGGCASPKLGGTRSMYDLASALGFGVAPPMPALCALETDTKPLRGLAGLRLLARLTLMDGARPVASAQGEALFGDSGISGVCAMQLARDAAQLVALGRQPTLNMDFSPLTGLCDAAMERKPPQMPGGSERQVLRWLEQRSLALPPERLLSGLLPRPLDARLTKATLADTARALTRFTLSVKGVRGFDHAQVTAGGVMTEGINPATMETRLPGLYMAGEMLDVDGDCGGYNLLFAFATGILAAEDITGK